MADSYADNGPSSDNDVVGTARRQCPTCSAPLHKDKCPRCRTTLKEARERLKCVEALRELALAPTGVLQEAADSLAKASTPENGLERAPGKRDNWVERAGKGGSGGRLPAYVEHIANDVHEKRGVPISEAIAIAIGAIKNWAHGHGNVDANTRAAAVKALAEWTAMKAAAHVKGAAKGAGKLAEAEDIFWLDGVSEALLEAIWDPDHHPRGRGGKFRFATTLRALARYAPGTKSVNPSRERAHGGRVRMRPVPTVTDEELLHRDLPYHAARFAAGYLTGKTGRRHGTQSQGPRGRAGDFRVVPLGRH